MGFCQETRKVTKTLLVSRCFKNETLSPQNVLGKQNNQASAFPAKDTHLDLSELWEVLMIIFLSQALQHRYTQESEMKKPIYIALDCHLS